MSLEKELNKAENLVNSLSKSISSLGAVILEKHEILNDPLKGEDIYDDVNQRIKNGVNAVINDLANVASGLTSLIAAKDMIARIDGAGDNVDRHEDYKYTDTLIRVQSSLKNLLPK